MILGLTGGSGSGKSTVANLLQEAGWTVIDCDKLGHEILLPGGSAEQEIKEHFGEKVMEMGKISRKKLGELVFSEPRELECLNKITHKHIREEIVRSIEGKDKVVIDGALLFESKMDDLCDRMIVVTCLKEERIRRIVERDGISREMAEKRISSQTDENVLTKRADVVIINDGDSELLREQVDKILKSW